MAVSQNRSEASRRWTRVSFGHCALTVSDNESLGVLGCFRTPKMLAQRKLSRRAARCAPAAVSLPQQALGGWLTIALIERITLKLRATRPPAQGLLDEVAGETATGPTP